MEARNHHKIASVRLYGLLSSAALVALLPGQAGAQTGGPAATDQALPAKDDSAPLEDIVVTAQRRSERLQQVPVAVSAVTAATLQAGGVKGIDTIQTAVPGLSVQNASGALALHLRGVGAIYGGPGYENPIALYVDGVYYASQNVGLLQFNNVERIEVLKGPQGTLFGRNATGGLVHIITKDPGQNMEFSGSLSYGNYNEIGAQLYAAGPVSSNLAAGVAFSFGRHDGWGRNLVTGSEVYRSDYDIGIRPKIVWTPGDFKFTLIGDYNTRSNSKSPLTNVEGSRVTPGGTPVSYPSPWDVTNNGDAKLKQRSDGVSLKAEHDIGTVTLSNQTAYRETRFTLAPLDYDGSPLQIFSIDESYKDWQFTNELQLSSGGGGRLKWVAGLFYYRFRGGTLHPAAVTLSEDPALNPAFPVGTIFIQGKQNVESISGYVQGDYELVDNLTLTLGARYTYEKRKFDGRGDAELLLPGNPVVPAIPRVVAEKSFKRPTFRAAINYRFTDDIMMYASVNTGFKSGGYNVNAPDYPYYRPEKITAYEIGEKADLFGRTVRLNMAAFYYDYRDLQTQLVQGAGTGIINGAKARIYGLDGDLTVFPVRNFQIDASLSLLNTKYRSFPAAPIGTPGGGQPVTIGDVSGNDLTYAPKVNFNLGATWTIPMGENEIVANANWLHSSSYFHEADNVIREPAYDKINASLTYKIDGGRFSFAAYVNNLTNESVLAVALTNPLGPQIQLMQPPRTYGVRLGWNF